MFPVYIRDQLAWMAVAFLAFKKWWRVGDSKVII